jgi:hypothetical protein
VTGLADKVARLGQWKADAIEVLEAWERVWEAAGRPGPLAASKADNVAEYVTTLRAEHEELKQWVSDACELLHELHPEFPPRLGFHEDMTDLLRRVENP